MHFCPLGFVLFTMILLPESSKSTPHCDANLVLTLEPSTLLEFARKDAPGFVMRSCVCMLGISWTRLAWSSASWTLLMCLLLARGREGDDDKSSRCVSHEDHALLSSLPLDGYLSFSNTSVAGSDFGRTQFSLPAAVLHPKSVSDVQAVVRAVASRPGLTLAAKGRGHSVHGQAQVTIVPVFSFRVLHSLRLYTLHWQHSSTLAL